MKDSRKRRTLRTFAVTLSGLFALICAFAAPAGTAQGLKEERKLEDKTASHVPVKIKVKNLQNKRWARDLEVEVKNTGQKPIYFIKVILLLPDVKSPNADPNGLRFFYGRDDLMDISVRAAPEDDPLEPGETHTIKLEEKFVLPWEREDLDPSWRNPKRFVVWPEVINFGDGTGFVGYSGTPIPGRRSSNSPCGAKAAPGIAAILAGSPPLNHIILRHRA